MRFIAFTCTCALPIYLHAILPPLWHSASQIEGLLHDPQLPKYLSSSESIHRIEKVEGGYKVVTNSLEMFVAVKTKSKGTGPASFEYTFNMPKKLPTAKS